MQNSIAPQRPPAPRPGTRPGPRAIAAPLLGASLLVMIAGCSSTSSFLERLDAIERLTREGAYEEAAQRSVQLDRALSDSSRLRPRLEEIQAQISIASGLSAARELSLADRDVEALQIIDELGAAHGDVPQILAWRQRTRAKLSDRWFDAAREAVATEQFDAARQAYAKSIEYDAERYLAEGLLEELDRIEEYRADVAEQRYYEGVRHFTDLEIAEAVQRFQSVDKYDPGNEAAERREREAKRVLAKSRVESAESLVKDGLFSAAAKEYVQAAELDPASEAIARNLTAMRTEAEVQEAITVARGKGLRQDFAGAQVLLEEAATKTALQTDAVATALKELDDTRTEATYARALDLEHDFQFDRALGVYGEILTSREFYKDVRARMDVIEGYIADAERLYAEAQAAGSDAEKIDAYRKIEVFWPEYRDVQDRIQALTRPNGGAGQIRSGR